VAVVDTKGIVAVTVEVTEVATVVATEAVAVVDTKEIVAVTVEVTEVATAEETVEATEVMTGVEIVEATVVVTEEEIAEVTEVVPQNPAIGVIVAIAEEEIGGKSVADIAQRPAQIIHLGDVITNHTVRPHSVQYNSFLRSSFFILND
ncbi:MAG: hypothetical protein P8Q39_03830, partial [Candidatus Thalassarchaeaceae archaeon]|nr:hypothetical protein [Candidatus Thalassarchaeaceae archaeon]